MTFFIFIKQQIYLFIYYMFIMIFKTWRRSKEEDKNMKIENYIGENPIIISCYSILFPIFLPFSNKSVSSSHRKPHAPVYLFATVYGCRWKQRV